MQLVNQVDGETVSCHFDSIEEMADYAAPFITERYANGMRTHLDTEARFYGKYCPTPGTAFAMARDGWDTHLQDTLDIASRAVETVEQETECLGFNPVWDVAGSIVDVGAYLAGEPECMIEMPPAPMTKFGRVVTLCASVSYSGSIRESTLIARGKVITALAIELSRLGIGLEIWADFSARERIDGGTKYELHERALVKGANDILDPSKVLFAFAHPGMLRCVALTAMHALPERFRDGLGVSRGYGIPCAPRQDLPDGTIYLPEVNSNYDIPDADAELRRYLTELGLVES
jgi:hypothetical protein